LGGAPLSDAIRAYARDAKSLSEAVELTRDAELLCPAVRPRALRI